MRHATIFILAILIGLMSQPVYSDPPKNSTTPPPNNSTTPPPKQTSIFDRPQQPSAWERIQDSVDRSTGRIIDEPSYQLDRIQRRRDENTGRIEPQTEFQRFNEEHERQLRIEQQERAAQITSERQRRDELDRREYELLLQTGLSSTSMQAMQDEQALNQAKGRRDQQITIADQQRAEALGAHPENRAQIEADYQRRVQEIRRQYEDARAKILGMPPATQPSP